MFCGNPNPSDSTACLPSIGERRTTYGHYSNFPDMILEPWRSTRLVALRFQSRLASLTPPINVLRFVRLHICCAFQNSAHSCQRNVGKQGESTNQSAIMKPEFHLWLLRVVNLYGYLKCNGLVVRTLARKAAGLGLNSQFWLISFLKYRRWNLLQVWYTKLYLI